MTEWGMDPTVVAKEWTSEYYNMMIRNFISRKNYESEQSNEKPKGPPAITAPEETMLRDFGIGGAEPYPHPIPATVKTD